MEFRIISCLICNQKVKVKTKFSNRKYCDNCRFKKCLNCGETFLQKPMAKNKKIFCSKDCFLKSPLLKELGLKVSKIGNKFRQQNKNGYFVKCSWCNKEIYRYLSRKKRKDNFCDKKCYHHWSRSARNENWKGDDYSENRRLRDSSRYKKWRTKIFNRDGYLCQNCGSNKKLTADHIKSWALYPKLRFRVSNGRTLCSDCHRKTDSWGIKSVYQNLRKSVVQDL